MRILVLGGDGYLGWPTALHFSQAAMTSGSSTTSSAVTTTTRWASTRLVPIRQLHRRVATWKEVTGHTVEPFIGDLTDDPFVLETIRAFDPEAVIHFAEQRSAPRTR